MVKDNLIEDLMRLNEGKKVNPAYNNPEVPEQARFDENDFQNLKENFNQLNISEETKSQIQGLINLGYDKLSIEGKSFLRVWIKGFSNLPSKEERELLENPLLLELINKELEKKVVGEYEARETIFMVANMRNVENLNKATDNLMINAPSGCGKDAICEAVFDLIPQNEKEELIRTTPKVLAYTRNRKINPFASWKKVALRLEDASNEVLNDDAFKVCSSANPNKINYSKTINRQKVIEIEQEGKPSIILTSAEGNPKEEQLRRYPICPLDEGINQTKEILKRQSQFAQTGKSFDYDETILNAISKLKRIKVKIPYAENLIKIFVSENVIIRTHYPRFLDYIKSSVALHQYQRKQDEQGYFIAERQDYEVAVMMLKKTTSNILMIPLTKIRRAILDLFEQQKLSNKSVDDLETYREIETLNITSEWLRKQLDWLASKTFLTKSRERRYDEAGKIIPKPVFIYSFNKMQTLDIPKWEQLEIKNLTETSSNTSNNNNTSNSSNTSNSGVSEVNEVKRQQTDIQQNEQKNDLEEFLND